MNDRQWRASVRADAIRCGNPPAVADYLAARVGKQPTEEERKHFHGDARVGRMFMSATARAHNVDERRRSICRVYSAEALLPAFVASRLPLPRVAAILANITGGQSITPSGLAAVRNQLQAMSYWGGTAS